MVYIDLQCKTSCQIYFQASEIYEKGMATRDEGGMATSNENNLKLINRCVCACACVCKK